jgi:hypothetical protein
MTISEVHTSERCLGDSSPTSPLPATIRQGQRWSILRVRIAGPQNVAFSNPVFISIIKACVWATTEPGAHLIIIKNSSDTTL